MDLDPLEPDEPDSAAEPPAVPGVDWAWNDSCCRRTPVREWAPAAGAATAPSQGDRSPWDTEAPADGAGETAGDPGSRAAPSVLAGATALADLVSPAAWAVRRGQRLATTPDGPDRAGGGGQRLHRVERFQRFQRVDRRHRVEQLHQLDRVRLPRETGAGGPGPLGNRRSSVACSRREVAGGTVATIDTTAHSFTVTRQPLARAGQPPPCPRRPSTMAPAVTPSQRRRSR